MYQAIQTEDGKYTFSEIKTIQDINGNEVQILESTNGEYTLEVLEQLKLNIQNNANKQIADVQSKIDAINSL